MAYGIPKILINFLYFAASISVYNSGTAFVPNTEVTLYIRCEFQRNVDCAWRRRGNHVEIGNRYGFSGQGIGINTRDCSIKIQPFNANIDYGEWMCESMADSSSEAEVGTVVNLQVGEYTSKCI